MGRWPARSLLTKFGGIPVIDMYKQASIRWQKVHDWEAARTWAERGLTVYGSEAIRDEVIDDLHKRVAHATEKLQQAARPHAARPSKKVTAANPHAAKTETLICSSCGASFERIRTRGRKPKLCPACRESSTPATAS